MLFYDHIAEIIMFFLQERFDCPEMFLRKKTEQGRTSQNFAVLYFHSAGMEAPRRRCVYLLVSSEKCRSSSRWSIRDLTFGSFGCGSILLMMRHSSNPSPRAIGSSTSSAETLRNLCWTSVEISSRTKSTRR